jgi:hypothetical protein
MVAIVVTPEAMREWVEGVRNGIPLADVLKTSKTPCLFIVRGCDREAWIERKNNTPNSK